MPVASGRHDLGTGRPGTSRDPARPSVLESTRWTQMRSSARSLVPDGLPVLQSGGHLVPEDGTCLLEHVWVLAGTAFSEHPACTDPPLAAVARLVNDACTVVGRQELVAFGPAPAGTGPVDASATAAVIRATVGAFDRATGGTHAAAARRLDVAAAALRRLPDPRRNRALRATRSAALAAAAASSGATGSGDGSALRPDGESTARPAMP
jgi:hypothetical protein